ncbi:MAG TPA: glycoside hydrolase family 16 protein [Chitinophagaceae bacterium]|nr:glycoside hydrolase family 16 protein [Chitinophagaceae bacterium]
MRTYHLLLLLFIPLVLSYCKKNVEAPPQPDYTLVWAEEFDKSGSPDETSWNFENGFIRNQELQWYQKENATIINGTLIIEARKEDKPTPYYDPNSSYWQDRRSKIEYSSASMHTKDKKSWKFGRFELKAKIPVANGIWPTWWTMGVEKDWPAGGEVDIMEYFKGNLITNLAYLGADRQAEFIPQLLNVDSLGGASWASQFHIWRMDWTPQYIEFFLDNKSLNKVPIDSLTNKDGTGFNPFTQPHFMILTLAVGGTNGGDPTGTIFPQKLEVDYIRVYQLK